MDNYIALGTTSGLIKIYDINNLDKPYSVLEEYQFNNIEKLKFIKSHNYLLSYDTDETLLVIKTDVHEADCLEYLLNINNKISFMDYYNDEFIFEFGVNNITKYNQNMEKSDEIIYNNSIDNKNNYYLNIGNYNNYFYYNVIENNKIKTFNVFNKELEYSNDISINNEYINKLLINKNNYYGYKNKSEIFTSKINEVNLKDQAESMFLD